MTGLAATVAALSLLAIGAAVLGGFGLRVPSIGLAGFGALYAVTLAVFEFIATITIRRRRFQKERAISRREDESLRLELWYRAIRFVFFAISFVLFFSIARLIYLSPERIWSFDSGQQSSTQLVHAIDGLTSNLSKLTLTREPLSVQVSTHQLARSIDELREAVEVFSAQDREMVGVVRIGGNNPYALTLVTFIVLVVFFIVSLVMAVVEKRPFHKIVWSLSATASLGFTLFSAENIEIHTVFGPTPAPTCTPAPTAVPSPTPVAGIELPSSPSFDFRSATPQETTLCGSSAVAEWAEWRASVAEIADMHAEGLRDLSIVVVGMADPVRLGALSRAHFGSNHGLARRRAEEVVRMMQSIAAFQRSRFVVATDAPDGTVTSLSAVICSPEFADQRRVKVLVSARAHDQHSSAEQCAHTRAPD